MLALDTIIFLTILLFPQPSACVQPGEELIQQYLVMQLEDRTVPLMVPRRFAEDAADRVQGATHGAQLFRLDTNTFEPVSRRETGEQLKQGRREYLQLLIGDFIDLKPMLHTRFAGFKATANDAYTKDFTFEPQNSGFNIIVGEVAPKNEELFFLGPADDPEILAQCKNRMINAKFQSCTLHFESFGVGAKIAIDKREFARWKEIKAGVDRFLACITTL